MAATYMPLKAETKITKNPNAKTFYLTIPAFLAQDSAFPFEDGSAVEVEIVTEEQHVGKGNLIVRKATAPKRK
jgi:hypothetical protein